MKKVTLRGTDLEVTQLCLGTMMWGTQNDEAEAHQQLDYAIDQAGINFIDTAEVYPIPPSRELQGDTEIIIGKWLARRGKRDDLVIATKVSPFPNHKTRQSNNPPTANKKDIRDAIAGSLQRLQTDYIDLYQIHWPVRQTNFFGPRAYPYNNDPGTTEIRETLQAMKELVDEGLIRYVGVSNETAWGVAEYLRLAREEDLPKIVTIQNQYSLTNRTFEIGISEFCARENISLLPYSILNMGVLTGKYLDGVMPEGARFSLTDRNAGRYKPDRKNVTEATRRYVELAKKHNLDPAQLSVAFCMSRGFIDSTIVAGSSVEQLRTNIEATTMTLADEILAEINEIYQEYPDVTV